MPRVSKKATPDYKDGVLRRVRTRKKGPPKASYRIDLRWKGYARVTLVYGQASTARADKEWLTEVWRNGRSDLIAAVANRTTTVADLRAAARGRSIAQLAAPPSAAIPALQQLKTEWLAYLATHPTSPRTRRPITTGTIERYTDCIDELTASLGAKCQVTKLTGALFSRAVSHIRGATRNRHITAFQSFARWFSSAYPASVPLTQKDYSACKEQETKADTSKALTQDELEMVIDKTIDPRYKRLWRILARTGLRIDEALSLTRAQVAPDGTWVKVVAGKTVNAPRTIPVFDPVVRAQLVEQRGGHGQPNARLWPESMNYGNARGHWGHACKRAGFTYTGPERPKQTRMKPTAKKTRTPQAPTAPEGKAKRVYGPSLPRPAKSIHGLRHSYGVMLARLSTPSHLLRSWLGHGSSRLSDRYTFAEAEAQDIARLNAAYQVLGAMPPMSTPAPPAGRHGAQRARRSTERKWRKTRTR